MFARFVQAKTVSTVKSELKSNLSKLKYYKTDEISDLTFSERLNLKTFSPFSTVISIHSCFPFHTHHYK